MTDDPVGGLPADARGDLLVAGAAAGATIALSVLLGVVFDRPTSVLRRMNRYYGEVLEPAPSWSSLPLAPSVVPA